VGDELGADFGGLGEDVVDLFGVEDFVDAVWRVSRGCSFSGFLGQVGNSLTRESHRWA
jgi:hypothetical protein